METTSALFDSHPSQFSRPTLLCASLPYLSLPIFAISIAYLVITLIVHLLSLFAPPLGSSRFNFPLSSSSPIFLLTLMLFFPIGAFHSLVYQGKILNVSKQTLSDLKWNVSASVETADSISFNVSTGPVFQNKIQQWASLVLQNTIWYIFLFISHTIIVLIL